MTTTDQQKPATGYAMTTLPNEYGLMGAEGIADLVKRATAHAPIATYVEEPEPPISWAAISDAGWDLVGIAEDESCASARDLVAIAKAWGYGSIPQPLLPSVLAKRWSAAAREADGPVTFAVPLGDGALVPFGAVDGIMVASALGAPGGGVTEVPAGEIDGLDLVGRGIHAPAATAFTADAAREVALVLAAEVLGGAERLLADSVAFVNEREQFGRPVGSFQAVKHKLATATVDVEAADTALIWGAQQEVNAFRGALFAVDRCIDAAEIAVHVHGGLGFTWEVGLHFPLRKMLSVRRIIERLEGDHA
ncbi:acyl-CoA dehydrogenase family protein [Rhodococcus aetherivorans]|uniref:acyl-CoA dehydrogenase family protein n=1 Tax=Rhodococcus aetherivorans TaxID=191292 RepID=UPI00364A9902